MARDTSYNSDFFHPSNGGILSLKKKKDDFTFGSVGPYSEDPIDYYKYTTLAGLKSVKAEIDIDPRGSKSLLQVGGVFGVTDHIDLSGFGTFSGRSLVLEVRLGLDAIGKSFERWDNYADHTYSRIFKAFLAGSTDDTLWDKMTFLSKFTQLADDIYENDGVNVNVKRIVAELREMVADEHVQGKYSGEITAAVNGVINALSEFYKPHYYRINGEAEKEISLTAFKNAAVTWSVKGGQDGYMTVLGSVETSSHVVGQDIVASLDYTAHISVKSEKTGRYDADLPIHDNQVSQHLASDHDSFLFL